MLRPLLRTCSLAVALCGLPAPATASSTQSDQDMEQARQVITRALDALGGEARLRALDTIYLAAEGTENLSANLQGLSSTEPTIREHQESFAARVNRPDVAWERRTPRNDMSLRWRRTIFHGDAWIYFNRLGRGSARRDPGDLAERAGLRRRIPHLLLLEAAERSEELVWIPREEHESPRTLVVALPVAGHEPLRLHFEPETHLLLRVTYRFHQAGLGDTLAEFLYQDYEEHPQLGWVPRRLIYRLNGEIFQDVRFTRFEADVPDAEELLTLPDEFRETPRGEPEEIADGVFYIAGLGGFNLLFVELDDFVVAVEAPASYPWPETLPAVNYSLETNVSRDYIAKIHAAVPDKPIRYVVITHHHNDHSGGAREFLAEGATLLTTPGNRRFFEQMAAAPHTLKPDAWQESGGQLQLETVSDRLVIGDGHRAVEVLSVGANPHTDEMLVVYLPGSKILFQGDLFYYVEGARFPPASRESITTFFARWLVERDLWPERIYSFHGYGFATPEDVQDALKLAE